eukprot:362321-Chlamydomonas_euryale.AAC.8
MAIFIAGHVHAPQQLPRDAASWARCEMSTGVGGGAAGSNSAARHALDGAGGHAMHAHAVQAHVVHARPVHAHAVQARAVHASGADP